MKRIIKFRRPFFKDSYPYEFSHFGEWGVELGNSSFASPPYNNSCTSKDDQMFTGLYDRYGKEVYEGDIIGLNDVIAPITWVDGGFQMITNENQGKSPAVQDRVKNFEVIGNICEHPNLLNNGNNKD